MNIYVASSWNNSYQPEVVKILRASGHEVYDFKNPAENKHGFLWSDIDVNYKSWKPKQFVDALNNPIVVAGFQSDFEAIKKADCCILVLPSGRSAHTEAGWMKGKGKLVYVYMPQPEEPELMYKFFDGILTSPEELKKI
jgi:nucleoside 2-deoxyribosyltransferase